MSALPFNNFIGFAAGRFKVSRFHAATILVLVALIDDRGRWPNPQSSDRLN
jgi:hypothetical protein